MKSEARKFGLTRSAAARAAFSLRSISSFHLAPEFDVCVTPQRNIALSNPVLHLVVHSPPRQRFRWGLVPIAHHPVMRQRHDILLAFSSPMRERGTMPSRESVITEINIAPLASYPIPAAASVTHAVCGWMMSLCAPDGGSPVTMT